MKKATYKDAGVDLDLYEQAMVRIARHVLRTHTPRVVPAERGFAGLFRLDFDSPLFARRYTEPVLVACSDGVGTKLKVATRVGDHSTVGIDLVAMNVNDALCCGAEPLFFLDYVALSRDDPALLEQLVAGIAAGCIEADCALLGGETAIMPDVYPPGQYDLAGFCVGVVERRNLIDGKAIVPGDLVIGLASSGLHSNGFSLVRKVVFEMAELDVDEHVDQLGTTVGRALLQPTRIYVRAVRNVLAYYRVKSVVHGIAHITGGGLADNVVRILPPGVQVVVQRGSWPVPPVFTWVQQLGRIDQAEMDRVFNLGVGLVMIASSYYAESIRSQLADCGIDSWIIGRVQAGEKAVLIEP